MKKTLLACAIGVATLGNSVHGAVYEVELLLANDLGLDVFSRSIDDAGRVLVLTRNKFNAPIELAYIDFTNEDVRNSFADPDAAQAGEFVDEDYFPLLLGFREAKRDNFLFGQKISEFHSFSYDGQLTEQVAGFDSFIIGTDELSGSAYVDVRDSLNGNFIVGSSEDGFAPFEFTNSDGNDITIVINGFRNRGFVEIDGVSYPLEAPYSQLGGNSQAHAINGNLQVVGFGVVSVSDVAQALVDSCADPEERVNLSVDTQEECDWRLNYPIDAARVSPLFEQTGAAEIRPIVWSIDTSGSVIAREVYDILEQPTEEGDSPLNYEARAFDINDAGIAVGFSEIPNPDSAIPNVEAAVFSNGQSTRLFEGDNFDSSGAIVINNNNWVAGTVSREVEGRNRDKLFVTNIDTGDVVEPTGFFPSSNMTPLAINDGNILVGGAEFEALPSGVRDRHAFMYDINTDTFTDLNDVIGCDAPYTLVSATGINENNEIVASARQRLPLRNDRGEVVLNSAGEEIPIDTIISVKLNPVPNGQAEDCGEEQSDLQERQGASGHPVWMALLLVGVWLRRFIR